MANNSSLEIQPYPPTTPEDQNDNNKNYPKYKGVRKRKWGKWVSEIRMANSRERIWLGSFDTPQKAARAFDAAQFCLRGRYASFNFPDSPPNIPGGESLSPHEIQAVATRFANDESIGQQQSSADQEDPPNDGSSSSSSYSSFSYSSKCQNPNYGSHYDSNVGGDGGGSNNNAMDCSFLNILDNNHNNCSYNYDSFDPFFSGQLYRMGSGEFSLPPIVPPDSIREEEIINYGDQSSSFLWNF